MRHRLAKRIHTFVVNVWLVCKTKSTLSVTYFLFNFPNGGISWSFARFDSSRRHNPPAWMSTARNQQHLPRTNMHSAIEPCASKTGHVQLNNVSKTSFSCSFLKQIQPALLAYPSSSYVLTLFCRFFIILLAKNRLNSLHGLLRKDRQPRRHDKTADESLACRSLCNQHCCIVGYT